MASITHQPNGRRTIQFVGPDGRRYSLRLGKVNKQAAESTRVRVERLLAARKLGETLDAETKTWLKRIDRTLEDRLVKVKLIDGRTSHTLGELSQRYLQRRTDLKPKSLKLLGNGLDRLQQFFGSDTSIHSITSADAGDWRRWMLSEGLSEATVRTYSRYAKQLFKDAQAREIVGCNPFASLPSGSVANQNNRIVSVDEMTQVLNACPSQDWRLLLALCRYAGLRCPSETHLLTWDDVDLDQGKLTVQCPKTEHHHGHEFRTVPIQPRLALELDAAARTRSGSRVVRLSRHNLHKGLARIIEASGVEPWADPFHCLRRSCETDWAEQFPEFAVAKWIGNSVTVARRHYLKLTDGLMERARREGR